MRLLGSVYNLKTVIEHYGRSIKISVTKPPGKNIGIGNLRVISIKERENRTELILAYEDYSR